MTTQEAKKPGPATTEAAEEAVTAAERGTTIFHALPPELAGLLSKGFKVREAPGISPTWAPGKNSGHPKSIVGQILEYKTGVGKFSQDCIVIAGKDQVWTVWLTVDLQTKVTAEAVGKIVALVYEGRRKMAETAKGEQHCYALYMIERGEAAAG